MSELVVNATVRSTPGTFLRRSSQQQERILFRVGAYAATTESRMFKRRKGSAPPGSPPYAHQPGKHGIKDVRYAVHRAAKTVTIGQPLYSGRRSSTPVPKLLDQGGTVLVTNRTFTGEQVTSVARYRPRPFRREALKTAVRYMNRAVQLERL